MDNEKKTQIRKDFRDEVNMQPKEIEDWLETESSKSVGQENSDASDTIGRDSAKRIIEIKRKNVDQLDDSDHEHMKKVVGYIRRHSAQKPEGDIKDSNWRYSLMNWGYDPCK